MSKPLITLTETSRLLAVSVATAYRMAEAGQLPIIRLAGNGQMRVIRSKLVEQYGIDEESVA